MILGAWELGLLYMDPFEYVILGAWELGSLGFCIWTPLVRDLGSLGAWGLGLLYMDPEMFNLLDYLIDYPLDYIID